MKSEGLKRKLAAILAADVEGYTRLMDDDEVATLDTLRDYRNAITAFIDRHHGRVVSTAGDTTAKSSRPETTPGASRTVPDGN